MPTRRRGSAKGSLKKGKYCRRQETNDEEERTRMVQVCVRLRVSGVQCFTLCIHDEGRIPGIQEKAPGISPYLCKTCTTRNLCIKNAKCEKTVSRHIWKEYVERAEDAYKKRQEKIEREFAYAKEKHGMRYTQYRALAQVSKWVKLKFAAINLKSWRPGNGKTAILFQTALPVALSLLFPFFSIPHKSPIPA